MTDSSDLVPLVSCQTIHDRHLVWVTDEVFAARAASGLLLLNTNTKAQQLLPVPLPYIVDAFAVTPPAPPSPAPTHAHSRQSVAHRSLIAIAVHGQDTCIHVYSYPMLELVQVVRAEADVTRFGALCWTSQHQLLAASTSSLYFFDIHAATPLLTSSPLPPSSAITSLLSCPFAPSRVLSLSTGGVAAVHLVSNLSSFQPPLLHTYPVQVSHARYGTQWSSGCWLSATSLVLTSTAGGVVHVVYGGEESRRVGRKDSVGEKAMQASAEQALPVTAKEVEQLGLTAQQPSDERPAEGEEETAGHLDGKVVYQLADGVHATSCALTKHHLMLATTAGEILFLDPASLEGCFRLTLDSASPLCHLSFNSSFSSLLLLCTKGRVQLLYHTSRHDSTVLTPQLLDSTVIATPAPCFVASTLCDLLPATPLTVTADEAVKCSAVTTLAVPSTLPGPAGRRAIVYSSSGLLQLWSYQPSAQLHSFTFDCEISAAAVSQDGQLCAVGLSSGALCILALPSATPSTGADDATDDSANTLRLIYTQRLHSGPILAVLHEPTAGTSGVWVSLSKEELWWLRASELKVLGYIKVRQVLNRLGLQSESLVQEKRRMDEERRQREEDDAFFASLIDNGKVVANDKPAERLAELDSPVSLTYLPDEGRLVVSSQQKQLMFLSSPAVANDSDELLLNETVIRPDYRTSESVLRYLQRHGRGDRFYAAMGGSVAVYEWRGEVLREVAVASDGHVADVTALALSPCGRFLVSGGEDGQLTIRNSESLALLASVQAAAYEWGGLTSVAVSTDSEYVLVAGRDGSSCCFALHRLHPHGKHTSTATEPPPTITPKVLDNLPTLPLLPRDAPSFLDQFAPPTPPSLPQPLVSMRTSLLETLGTVSMLVTATRTRNNQLPSQSQLAWAETTINTQRRDALVQEAEQQLAGRAEAIEREHRGAELVCERIVDECWSSQAVKGAVVRGFGSGEEVRNFGLRVRSEKEVRRMRQLQLMREMELAERRWRWMERERQREAAAESRDIHSSHSSLRSAGAQRGGDSDGSYWPHNYCEGVEYIMHSDDAQHPNHITEPAETNNPAIHSASLLPPSSASASRSDPPSRAKDGGTARKDNAAAKPAATRTFTLQVSSTVDSLQSSTVTFAVPAYYLYHPLDVITAGRRRVQWLLLLEKQVWAQQSYNATFAEFAAQKQRDITALADKSKRMSEIAIELNMPDPATVNMRYELTDEERADSVLTVNQSEMRHSKPNNSPPAATQPDEKRVESEAALQAMMHGSLEAKRDLSSLEAELVPAEWMSRPLEELSEEEKAELLRFEKKVKMIEAERESRRKMLQAEYNKVRSDCADIARAFDYKVKAMCDARLRCEKDVLMLEWYRQRLAIADEQECVRRRARAQRQRRVLHTRGMRERLLDRMDAFRVSVEDEQAGYEQLAADTRLADKALKKEVTEAGENYDHLCKLYRIKRMKLSTLNPTLAGRRSSAIASDGAVSVGPRHRSRASTMSIAAVSLHGPKASLFGIEGLTGAGLNVMNRGKRRSVIEHKHDDELHDGDDLFGSLSPYPEPQQPAVDEAESLPPFHQSDAEVVPPDMNASLWSKFVEKRRTVVEREAELKVRQTRLADMHKYYMRLQTVEEWVHQLVGEADSDEDGMEDERQTVLEQRAQWDAVLMLRIQQGLVELSEVDLVYVLSDVQLVSRSELEQLNAVILAKGGDKLSVLRDMQRFEQEKELLEWKQRMLQLQYEQALDLTTQLQLLRVTKQMQAQIRDREEGRTDQLQLHSTAQHIALERKMEHVRASVRTLNADKTAELTRLRRRTQRITRENETLAGRVQQLQQAVQQRQAIDTLRDDGQRERASEERRRMRDVVGRRRLMDLARLQQEEIAWLRSQVDALRKKTFASFAGVGVAPTRRGLGGHEEEKQMMSDGGRGKEKSAAKEKRLILPAI